MYYYYYSAHPPPGPHHLFFKVLGSKRNEGRCRRLSWRGKIHATANCFKLFREKALSFNWTEKTVRRANAIEGQLITSHHGNTENFLRHGNLLLCINALPVLYPTLFFFGNAPRRKLVGGVVQDWIYDTYIQAEERAPDYCQDETASGTSISKKYSINKVSNDSLMEHRKQMSSPKGHQEDPISREYAFSRSELEIAKCVLLLRTH